MTDLPKTRLSSTDMNLKVILALTLVHFSGDFFSSFINPLLPVFVEKYSLTLTQVGILTGISRVLAFVVQPCVGYFADRYRTRVFVLGGLILVALFIPASGVAFGYLSLLVFVGLGSIGSSMFHPTCAGMIPDYSGYKPGLAMSIFNTGGTLAFGVGPIFITWFVGRYGLHAMPWTMLFGAAALVYLVRVLPPPRGEGLRSLGFWGSIRDAFGEVWRPLSFLWLIMVLRSFTGQSIFSFAPILLAERGNSLVYVGAMVSFFTVGGAVSGIVAGHLSDRMGFRKIFIVTHALSTPALLLMLYVPGTWVHVTALFAGMLLLATLPLGVLMAQELAPRGKSMGSSLMMGLAFGTGGMLTPVTGKMADMYGIHPVLVGVSFVPLITIALAAALPELKR